MSRINLPNGASCTPLNVWPKNWKTKKASTVKPWYITYRFHWNGQKKLVMVKGMNEVAERDERQNVTMAILDHEMRRLLNGYNPITREIAPETYPSEMNPDTMFLDALKAAKTWAKVATSTLADIASMLKRLEEAIIRCNFLYMPISSVRRRHIMAILQDCEKNAKPGKWSANTFNKYRAYLMILFRILIRHEVVENNPVTGIDKEVVIRRVRETLSPEQRKKVKAALADNREYFRFIQIFFHSGARLVELTSIRKEDVDMEGQQYKAIIAKGKQYRETWRPIKNIAVPFWTEVLNDTPTGQYLFGSMLKPGPRPCRQDWISKKWKEMVKEKLGVTADLYSLKHLNLTEVSDILGTEAAASLAGHSSTAMVAKVYDIRNRQRTDDAIKLVGNEF